MCHSTSDTSTNTNTNVNSRKRRPSTVSPFLIAAEIMGDLASEDDIDNCQHSRNQTEARPATFTKKLKNNVDFYYGTLNDEIEEEGRRTNQYQPSSSTKTRTKNLGRTYDCRPRPDSKGRVGRKECHFFSFCGDLDDEIEFELAQEEADDKDYNQ